MGKQSSDTKLLLIFGVWTEALIFCDKETRCFTQYIKSVTVSFIKRHVFCEIFSNKCTLLQYCNIFLTFIAVKLK